MSSIGPSKPRGQAKVPKYVRELWDAFKAIQAPCCRSHLAGWIAGGVRRFAGLPFGDSARAQAERIGVLVILLTDPEQAALSRLIQGMLLGEVDGPAVERIVFGNNRFGRRPAKCSPDGKELAKRAGYLFGQLTEPHKESVLEYAEQLLDIDQGDSADVAA